MKILKFRKIWNSEKCEILCFEKILEKLFNFFVLCKNVEKYIILGEVY